ncbi:hypothetical protein JFL43_04550 [Viridibacillus sp. YIM B01967]|uniref:Uncharacterized protein n=1 Tax=Viridibacillus soli TaxID=2798301 RepID=A0ABS1H3Y9_9BACL|nr:hypothetical protein [Viridibacillus soli]MBK3494139.1 hypothetical protein [Viridibacillus soli]
MKRLMTGDEKLLEKAQKMVTAFVEDKLRYPSSTLSLLSVELATFANAREVHMQGAEAEEVVRELQTTYRSHDVWMQEHILDCQLSVQICQLNCIMWMK